MDTKQLIHQISTIVLFATLTISCQQNSCLSTNCQNGGTCNHGHCDCPPNYYGTECEHKDLCYNMTCLNLGYCDDGQCVCDDGWGGSDCSVPLEPISMTIESVVVWAYPTYRGGSSNWDSQQSGQDVYADAYITLNSGTTPNHANYVSDIKDNVQYQALNYSTGLPTLLPYNQESSITLWDYDGFNNNQDEIMFHRSFDPKDYSDGRPDRFTVEALYGTVEFYVVWNY